MLSPCCVCARAGADDLTHGAVLQIVMDGTLVPAKQPTAMQRENDLIKTIKQLTCSDKYVSHISRWKALRISATFLACPRSSSHMIDTVLTPHGEEKNFFLAVAMTSKQSSTPHGC